ncbi:MAG: L-histidine N(alpha)-methyltransferase, partial [Flavobacteriales bacterium]
EPICLDPLNAIRIFQMQANHRKSMVYCFTTKSKEIVNSFEKQIDEPFELIELGAGDGTKTIKILQQLLKEGYQVNYIPIDISQHALNGLEAMLNENLPELNVSPMQGTYFDVLKTLKTKNIPKVILFLGSNLGNLLDNEARKFLSALSESINKGDKVLLGLDTLKSKEIVLPAYNDKQGITRAFNLNLLDRINRELDADFDRQHFEHKPFYDEKEGIAKSYIQSKIDQNVKIQSLNKVFSFKKGENIHTEVSRKYNKTILEDILQSSQLNIETIHQDQKKYFMDVILGMGSK